MLEIRTSGQLNHSNTRCMLCVIHETMAWGFRFFIYVNQYWMWNSWHFHVRISNENIHISSPQASKQHKVQ